MIEQETRENADPVAAHLRDGSVSVAVVHEPERAIAVPALDVLGQHCAEQAVATDPGDVSIDAAANLTPKQLAAASLLIWVRKTPR